MTEKQRTAYKEREEKKEEEGKKRLCLKKVPRRRRRKKTRWFKRFIISFPYCVLMLGQRDVREKRNKSM